MGRSVGKPSFGFCVLFFIAALVCIALRDNALTTEATWMLIALLLTNAGIYGYAIQVSLLYLKGRGFSPWNKNFNQASACFLISTTSLMVFYSYDYRWIDLLVGGIFLGIGLRFLKSGIKRMHGITVEKKAIKSLKKTLKGRCRIDTDISFDGIGNIDALISDFSGLNQKWVIEIKSWHGLRLTGNHCLVKMNGSAPYGNPIGQVLRQADAVGHAKPVLWMPCAVRSSAFRYQGVTIINGDSDFLLKTLASNRILL